MRKGSNLPVPVCEWCGDSHPIERLCSGRPRFGRRGFLSLVGMGLLGLVIKGWAFNPLAPMLGPRLELLDRFGSVFMTRRVAEPGRSVMQIDVGHPIWDARLYHPEMDRALYPDGYSRVELHGESYPVMSSLTVEINISPLGSPDWLEEMRAGHGK